MLYWIIVVENYSLMGQMVFVASLLPYAGWGLVIMGTTYKRVLYEVLDHDATYTDLEAFLGRLKTALAERGLVLKDITTDSSALYPEPLHIVWGFA